MDFRSGKLAAITEEKNKMEEEEEKEEEEKEEEKEEEEKKVRESNNSLANESHDDKSPFNHEGYQRRNCSCPSILMCVLLSYFFDKKEKTAQKNNILL